MFDVKKYEQIKKGYRLMSYLDLIIIFCSFAFVYLIFVGSGGVMFYLILICVSLILKYWIKSKITIFENEEN